MIQDVKDAYVTNAVKMFKEFFESNETIPSNASLKKDIAITRSSLTPTYTVRPSEIPIKKIDEVEKN